MAQKKKFKALWFGSKKKRNSLPSDKIHCVCPDGHNYLDTEYKFKEDGEISEMLVNYFCLPVS